jgi:hypothetical protein
LLVIANKFICDNKIIENIPNRLGSPGTISGLEPDTPDKWINIPNDKLDMLRKLNDISSDKCIENFEANEEKTSEEKTNENSTSKCHRNMTADTDTNNYYDNYTRRFVDAYYHPNFYGDDEHYKRLSGNRKNLYNTGVYPEPINDRPDLSQCQPCPSPPSCPVKCEPCPTKKTVLVHKLSPKLLEKIKKKLKEL